MSNADEWLSRNRGGSGYPAVAFLAVGDRVIGTITSLPRIAKMKDDDGQEQEVLVVELRSGPQSTAKKGRKGADGPIQDGDNLTLWVRPGPMAGAVYDAVQEAGARGLSEGDDLAVGFSEEKDTGKVQALKIYVARYTPAKPSTSLSTLV